MFKTVKSKFIFSATAIVLLAVAFPSLFLIWQFKENFEERSKAMLDTTLDVVYACIRHSMLTEEKNINAVIARHVTNENIDKIRIHNESGIISFSTDSSEIGGNMNLVSAHHYDSTGSRQISLLDSEQLYSLSIPLKNEKNCQRCHDSVGTIAYLDIDTHMTRSEIRFYTGVRHTLFLAIAVIIILILGLYLLFNRYINQPLKDVIHGLDEVEKGNLQIRTKHEKDDEFGVLNTHFNNMVSRLESSRKEIESFHFEQLQRADKMVTLGEFAAEMAHEINNPAGVIMSRADFLQMEMNDNPALQKFSDDIDVILGQTQKVARITSNILKYSKKLPKDFRQVNLVDCVNESLKILEPRLKKRFIEVNNKYICEYGCEKANIYGDAQQIEQVITNLINNAIDAMGNNGKLDITVTCTEDKILLAVKDTGPGIDEITLKQIFMPFFTTKSAQKGTGLGLYIVRNICKNHNAEIRCESTPGRGTSFYLEFVKMEDDA